MDPGHVKVTTSQAAGAARSRARADDARRVLLVIDTVPDDPAARSALAGAARIPMRWLRERAERGERVVVDRGRTNAETERRALEIAAAGGVTRTLTAAGCLRLAVALALCGAGMPLALAGVWLGQTAGLAVAALGGLVSLFGVALLVGGVLARSRFASAVGALPPAPPDDLLPSWERLWEARRLLAASELPSVAASDLRTMLDGLEADLESAGRIASAADTARSALSADPGRQGRTEAAARAALEDLADTDQRRRTASSVSAEVLEVLGEVTRELEDGHLRADPTPALARLARVSAAHKARRSGRAHG